MTSYETEKAAGVCFERWRREQARIVFAEPLELYKDDGSLKPLSEVSADARAAIVSVEVEPRMDSDGNETVTDRKVKLHRKTVALESISRALGVYEKSNRQRSDIIPVEVEAPD
ncbi:MAG: hypothetical protein ACPGSC_11980 [Granulosicoccaceae bacterium]